MWEKSFSHIVSNTPRGVTFAFKDGSTAKSDLLVGADGINSAVRAFVSPGTNPEYVITALNFCVPATTFPKDFPARFSMTTQHGAFIATPQNPLGKEKLCFRLLPISEPEGNEEVKKREWKRLAADKEWALSMLRKDIDSLPELWRMAIDSVDKVHIGVWPFHVLPKLPSWASLAETEGGEGGGIILIGDSAHGLPPSGAQGANQAFEDAYTLAFALSQISTDAPLKTVLESWQNRRTERVDQISRMTMQMNVARLPPQAQQKLIEEGKWSKSWERSFSGDFYRWLYVPNLKESFLDQVKDS
ncbi:MAG: hypothetical protein M1820_004780 [Bogoriella megaspora]|nr:MAG: hypothetical protein M1820_004780 [Bogoriella megaspora]